MQFETLAPQDLCSLEWMQKLISERCWRKEQKRLKVWRISCRLHDVIFLKT